MAQHPRSKPDLARLRRDFKAAARGDLEIVHDRLAPAPEVWGGFLHWLVYVRPASTGLYQVTYRFNYPGGDYSRGERSYEFRVAERGCRRSTMPYVSSGNYCLGDTVILPIRLDGLLDHKFSVVRAPEQLPLEEKKRTFEPAQPQPSPDSIKNPLADNLK